MLEPAESSTTSPGTNSSTATPVWRPSRSTEAFTATVANSFSTAVAAPRSCQKPSSALTPTIPRMMIPSVGSCSAKDSTAAAIRNRTRGLVTCRSSIVGVSERLRSPSKFGPVRARRSATVSAARPLGDDCSPDSTSAVAMLQNERNTSGAADASSGLTELGDFNARMEVSSHLHGAMMPPNAHAQRRGPQYHQPQTEPPSCTPPLFPPSGYSRRGERSPRRCFRTVRAGFLAHGSSVIRPLSWAPCRAGDRHGRASPWRVIPPSLHGGRTAAAARLVPITSLAPAPRQPLHGLSPRRWLLGPSHHRGVSGGHLRTDAASCILGASAMPAA